MSTAAKARKREHDGRYAFDGDLTRLCVCRHSLAVHSAGSPADCLLYSLPPNDPQRASENQYGGIEECGCIKFRLSKYQPVATTRHYCTNGCGAEVTETDIEAGYCTNCGKVGPLRGGKK